VAVIQVAHEMRCTAASRAAAVEITRLDAERITAVIATARCYR
jgi:hypothetical protein